ncbi:hypothetical protein Ddc_17223 [Ditylenchus destructor]|nr:hypothetical protein Ddc_17223 [Ditylenchus destructor]
MECCEYLIVPNSNQITVKRNVWNFLPLDIQLDVFQCLRAYDLYRNGRFVSHQWRNTIEQHKGILPKFRQLLDCREQNKLFESNDECRQRHYEMSQKIGKADERTDRINESLITAYLLLIILNFIAILFAQPISAEKIAANALLLTATLRTGETYQKIVDDDDDKFLICRRKCLIDLKPLKYVWAAYLIGRSLIFIGFAILVHLIGPQADTLFHTILATLYLPEGAYLINWSINASRFSFWFNSKYKDIVKELRPELRGSFVYRNGEYRLANGHIPASVNNYVWIYLKQKQGREGDIRSMLVKGVPLDFH